MEQVQPKDSTKKFNTVTADQFFLLHPDQTKVYLRKYKRQLVKMLPGLLKEQVQIVRH